MISFLKIKNIHRKDPRDVGRWIFDHNLKKWVEDESISGEHHDRDLSKRDITIDSKVIFYLGGFPRQGNMTLRIILLHLFPEMAMPDFLNHVVTLSKKAILDEKIVFYTIRNPHDAILSFMSMNYKLWPNDYIFEKKRDKKEIIDKYINFYIRQCSFIKDNLKKIYVIPFEKIVQICDDYLYGNINDNEIIRQIADKFDLTIQSYSKNPDEVNFYDSTSSKEVEHLMLDNHYYRRKIKKANRLYDEIIELLK